MIQLVFMVLIMPGLQMYAYSDNEDDESQGPTSCKWLFDMTGELMKAMAEMKRFGEAETAKRQQLEKALQEANNLHKRELAAKNEELAEMHTELGYLVYPVKLHANSFNPDVCIIANLASAGDSRCMLKLYAWMARTVMAFMRAAFAPQTTYLPSLALIFKMKKNGNTPHL